MVSGNTVTVMVLVTFCAAASGIPTPSADAVVPEALVQDADCKHANGGAEQEDVDLIFRDGGGKLSSHELSCICQTSEARACTNDMHARNCKSNGCWGAGGDKVSGGTGQTESTAAVDGDFDCTSCNDDHCSSFLSICPH